MEKVIKHYTLMGYKVSFKRGVTHHLEISMMKDGRMISQQFKDDHFDVEYVRELLLYIHDKFKNK